MTNRDDKDPGELADKLEHEADKLESRSEELGDEVDRVRQDWQRKRADEGVPGAVPDDDTSDAAPSEKDRQTRNEEPG